MRVMQGRGDWRPNHRISTLRRYAFIGDSHAYGHGVAPDQTLPAYAERQMNETIPGWPIEAVNLGANGYNIWNSWLMFRHAPLVYDGIVVALCNNDADLFGRTYQVRPPERHQLRWEIAHPFGAAVVRCFEDMALFSRETALPIAVCYYNVYNQWEQLRVGEIIGELCASHGFPFIDTFAHYRERNMARDILLVSTSDFHPSALAHEAVGRHLVATLKRNGWFEQYEASSIGDAPDRIVDAVRVMVDSDAYPPDAALT